MLLLLMFGAGITYAGVTSGTIVLLDRELLLVKQEQLAVAADLAEQKVLENRNYNTLLAKLESIEDDVSATKSDVAIIKFRQDQADRAPSLGTFEQYFRDLAQQ